MTDLSGRSGPLKRDARAWAAEEAHEHGTPSRSTQAPSTQAPSKPPRTETADDLPHRIARVHESGLEWLFSIQKPDGHWIGQIFTNATMEAEWVLLMHVLGVGQSDPRTPLVVNSILEDRRSDGSWAIYPDAPRGDVSTTVECYAALRAVGHAADEPDMVRTRAWILEEGGGIVNVRAFTRYWLALLGELPWDQVPAMPPEMVLIPEFAPLSLKQFASWARATIVPLAILSARRFSVPLPEASRLDELFPNGRGHDFAWVDAQSGNGAWGRAFKLVDQVLRTYARFRWRPGRERAIQMCREWIVSRQEKDGAWAGIQPPWVYNLMALRAEGYPLEHPVMAAGIQAFREPWEIRKGETVRFQASLSPVWDTVLTLLCIGERGHDPNDRRLHRAVDWVLGEQVNEPFDGPAGGWAFEPANRTYPDVDDTAVAVLALARVQEVLQSGELAARELADRCSSAIDGGIQFIEALQCREGGWAAFDKDQDARLITRIPFCDFGEVLDPPSVDVTAHAIEAFAAVGRGLEDPVVQKAVRWIQSEQESDGSWFGRWGVNHVYGTSHVIAGLAAQGLDDREPWIARGVEWLLKVQNDDGGFGESCGSYMDERLRGVGESSASQTGWGLTGLLCAESRPEVDVAIERATEWLLEHQADDGHWPETAYTGTGFPGYGVGGRIDSSTMEGLPQDASLQRAFMLRYELYAQVFPLLALGRRLTTTWRNHGE